MVCSSFWDVIDREEFASVGLITDPELFGKEYVTYFITES